MKAKLRLLGIVALAAIIGFVLVACSSDSSDGATEVGLFTYNEGGADYRLEIMREGGRYTWQQGDRYRMTIRDGNRTMRSDGMVEDFNSNTSVFLLKPDPLTANDTTTQLPTFNIRVTEAGRIDSIPAGIPINGGDLSQGPEFTPPPADAGLIAPPGSAGIRPGTPGAPSGGGGGGGGGNGGGGGVSPPPTAVVITGIKSFTWTGATAVWPYQKDVATAVTAGSWAIIGTNEAGADVTLTANAVAPVWAIDNIATSGAAPSNFGEQANHFLRTTITLPSGSSFADPVGGLDVPEDESVKIQRNAGGQSAVVWLKVETPEVGDVSATAAMTAITVLGLTAPSSGASTTVDATTGIALRWPGGTRPNVNIPVDWTETKWIKTSDSSDAGGTFTTSEEYSLKVVTTGAGHVFTGIAPAGITTGSGGTVTIPTAGATGPLTFLVAFGATADPITVAATSNGTDGSAVTTEIAVTLGSAVVGLDASDFAITAASGQTAPTITTATANGTSTVYTLVLSTIGDVNIGMVNVVVNKAGVSDTAVAVRIRRATPIAVSTAVPSASGGSGAHNTITVTFAQSIAGMTPALTIPNIAIGGTGAVAGLAFGGLGATLTSALNTNGTELTLTMTTVTTPGAATIAFTHAGIATGNTNLSDDLADS